MKSNHVGVRPGRASLRPGLVQPATILAVAALCLVSPAGAASLDVTPSAAFSGDYGLALGVGTTCAADWDAHYELQTVTETGQLFEGCVTLTAGNDFVIAGTGSATFTAGSTIVLENGFAVEAGGSFTAVIDSNDAPFAYVQDNSPAAEPTYNAQFYVDLDLLDLAAGDQVEHFVAYDSGGTPQIKLLIETGPTLVLEVRDSAGTFHSTSGVPTVPGFNQVVISWAAAVSSTASLTVNGGGPALVTADTSIGQIDSVRWGAVGGTFPSSSGEIAQDEFVSWR
jgi:hypothetical protein